jgi:hypothetical protein
LAKVEAFSDIGFASLEIDHSGICSENLQQTKCPVASGQTTGPAFRVVEIAEYEGRGWAALDTSRLDITIQNRKSFSGFINFYSADALDAEGTLFDNPPLTDRHVGVQLLFEWFGKFWGEPIVFSNFVGTRTPTESSPYTSVVYLRVQSFWGVIGRKYWTYGLAGRFGALLAKYRHELRFHVRITTLPISLDADPVQCATEGGFFFTHNWDVVLGMTSNYTCLTACAAV